MIYPSDSSAGEGLEAPIKVGDSRKNTTALSPAVQMKPSKRQRISNMFRWLMIFFGWMSIREFLPKPGETSLSFIAGGFFGIFISVAIFMFLDQVDHD